MSSRSEGVENSETWATATLTNRIHIFGASGSGTTTLGVVVADRLKARFLDTDNYFWKDTNPPFTEKNPRADRVTMIERDIAGWENWILSGSICGWGDPLIQRFSLAVFLFLDPTIRLKRLEHRERVRYGHRMEREGDMHGTHKRFLAWAESYDHASAPTRSLELHEAWMLQLDCPVLRLNSQRPVEELSETVLRQAVD